MNKKMVYWVLVGVLFTVTVGAVIMAANTLFRGLSKEDIELGRLLREAEGMDSAATRSRAPYVMFRPESDHKTMPITNSFGFHSPEISKNKPSDEYRIAIVGGSTVFDSGPQGLDSPSSTTYLSQSIAGQLAGIMKERLPGLVNKRITYINAGIPSAVSGQEVAQLTHHLLDMNIDLLVVYDGFNDFYIPFNYDKRPGYPYDYIVEEYRFLKGRAGIGGDTPLNNINKMYKELGYQISEDGARRKDVLEKYLFNITAMTKLAEGFGIKTGIFLQPYSERNMNPLISKNNENTIKLFRAASKAYGFLAKDNGSSIVFGDLTYMSRSLDEEFTDIVHVWWKPAHYRIADEIFKKLDSYRIFSDLEYLEKSPQSTQAKHENILIEKYHNLINEAIVSSASNLSDDLTEEELAYYRTLGKPGIGTGAKDGLTKFYGGKLPLELAKVIHAENDSAHALSEKNKSTPKFKDSELSEDVCSGGKAISGGDHKDGYLASMAFDKNDSTIWGSAQVGPSVADHAYIGYDFGKGETYAVRRISIKQGGRVERLKVQSMMAEGAQWLDVSIVGKYQEKGRDVLELAGSASARYWRVLAASNAGDNPAAWTVYEIQMNVKK